MKKNLTELVFILDRSGSMGGLEQDTIGGFNAMLTRQKEQEGEANVTTILFDHEVQLLHDRFPLKAVAPLTEKDYYVRGCTALLDAIDPVPFGNHAMQEEQGCFTSKGYLTLSGDEWEHERPRERQTEKKPSIKERLGQSRKECAGQSKAQPHREKPAPER